MIRINLLPVREERRKADIRQFAVMLAGTLVASLAAVAFFHWTVSSEISRTKDAVAQTQRQIDQFGPQLKQVEEYRKTKAEIEQKLEVIDRLDQNRSGPVHVLDEIATHAPDKLWVTKVAARGQKITIEGMSLDNEIVAHFMTALNESPYFEDVELAETAAKQQGGFKLNEFELSAGITSPGAKKPAAVEPKPARKTARAAAPAAAGR